jgi:hypothetical protein
MPTYRVLNKEYRRATMRQETVLDANKTPFTVLVPGPPLVYPVDSLMTDLNPQELAAFPDRFSREKDEPSDAEVWNPAVGLPAEAQSPQGQEKQELHPDLYALVRRAATGGATSDEQAIIGDVLDYMDKYRAGTATAEDTALITEMLTEFGIPLFA